MRKSQGKITDSQNQTKYTNQTGKRHNLDCRLNNLLANFHIVVVAHYQFYIKPIVSINMVVRFSLMIRIVQANFTYLGEKLFGD